MNVECSTRVKPFTGGHIDGEIWIELLSQLKNLTVIGPF